MTDPQNLATELKAALEQLGLRADTDTPEQSRDLEWYNSHLYLLGKYKKPDAEDPSDNEER
jgi:hypothetical protein